MAGFSFLGFLIGRQKARREGDKTRHVLLTTPRDERINNKYYEGKPVLAPGSLGQSEGTWLLCKQRWRKKRELTVTQVWTNSHRRERERKSREGARSGHGEIDRNEREQVSGPDNIWVFSSPSRFYSRCLFWGNLLTPIRSQAERWPRTDRRTKS